LQQAVQPPSSNLLRWRHSHVCKTAFSNRYKSLRHSPHVGAIVLRAKAEPVFVDLGPLELLRPMIVDLSKEMGSDDAGYIAALDLHAALVEPLSAHLANISTVYLAPAGPLGLVPFELLLDAEDRRWGDIKELRMTPTGRSLLRGTDVATVYGKGLVAFGAVDFDAIPSADSEPDRAEVQTFLAMAEDVRARPEELSKRSGAARSFVSLPHTATELAAITDIWRTETGEEATTFMASAASETALKGVHNPRVLHLATHGFVKRSDMERTASEGRTALLTGIALAGANRRNGANSVAPSQDAAESRGLALGYEIEALDLYNTELVVVSACETGRGPTDANEGVYSLARAFRIAGAGAVLVTLKPVDDALTAEFMAEYYRTWLTLRRNGVKTTPAQSLATVKRRWAQSSNRTKSDPRSWAPFIIVHNEK